jgi:ADP-ribose pyrophosphatase YjhB (NUDIX family)
MIKSVIKDELVMHVD